MIKLPEILKEKANEIRSDSFSKGIVFAFKILTKAGWHSKEDCVNALQSRLDVQDYFKRKGWHSMKDCAKHYDEVSNER